MSLADFDTCVESERISDGLADWSWSEEHGLLHSRPAFQCLAPGTADTRVNDDPVGWEMTNDIAEQLVGEENGVRSDVGCRWRDDRGCCRLRRRRCVRRRHPSSGQGKQAELVELNVLEV